MASILGKKLLLILYVSITVGCTLSMATDVRKNASAAGNDFALDLYSRLADSEGNLFFSPASIETALAMTYAGAKSRTAKQMAKVLHFEKAGQGVHQEFQSLLQQLNNPSIVKSYEKIGDEIKPVEKPAYELVIANALWGQQGYPWNQAFLTLTESNYGAGLRPVDFANHPDEARKTINDWVEEKTRDRIKDLIAKGTISPMMRLILTNAIYFKAAWADTFDDHATREMPFHVSESSQVPVSMMFQNKDFHYLETDCFQALEMPYKAYELSMIVFLPKMANGLDNFEKALSAEKLDGWRAALHREEVEVYFPKFVFTSSFSLSKTLKALGMEDAFSPTSADFSGMTTAEERVFISEVIHKAFVAVDENGTTAAAATAVMMQATAMPMPKPEPKVFRADHPFLFCIFHNPTGKILFMGRVTDPRT
ncbi:serpin family protein [uncultured Desulfosarcina sp.]|uniref:serpin family protein n=1 Tax=uncultured Desulfosarcina sp. TaxID=218289 RepID=UPI0029C8515A|nr:serpin family protein [uncultured Desulfosarcina sp.]